MRVIIKLWFIAVAMFLYAKAFTQEKFNFRIAPGAKMGEVVIKGKIGNLNYPAQLWYYTGGKPYDTIPIKNGVFEVRRKAMLPSFGALILRYTPLQKGSVFTGANLIDVFFEEGTITINSNVDTLKNYAVIKGSRLNEQFRAYYQAEGALLKEWKALALKFNAAPAEKLQDAKFVAAYEADNALVYPKFENLITREIKKYPRSFATQVAFLNFLKYSEIKDTTKALAVFNLFPEDVKASEHGKAMRARALNVVPPPAPSDEQMALMEERMKTTLTSKFNKGDIIPEFTQSDINGNHISLSQFRGRYVLLDFWASWCKPCRASNPKLVQLYHKYKGPKFEVLSISIDSKKEDWLKAISEDRLPWPQVWDLKGGENEVYRMFGLNAVPNYFLVDPEGRVVNRYFNVASLEKDIETILEKRK